MQARFAPSGLYQRLVDQNNPAITFQLLDLGQFNLSDEHYIKMNARGKPLTPFKTFKARFEQHLRTHFADLKLPISKGVLVDQFFARRMDEHWSDFFRPHRDEATATFDTAIMTVLRVVVLVTRDPEEAEQTDLDLALLRSESASTFSAFNDRQWLDARLVSGLLSLLEVWSQQEGGLSAQLPAGNPFDLQGVASKIMADPSKLTFQELAMLAGYVQFIADAQGDIASETLGNWMRVVFNLAVNTDYNRPEDLRRSFADLVATASRMGEITTYLAESDADIAGFSRPQVVEERLKAHLINLGDGWPERIGRAERHDYLKGQIGFLLRFSGFDLDDVQDNRAALDVATARKSVNAFEHYLACANQMLHDLRAVTEEGRNWELALLAQGDIRMRAEANHVLPGIKEGAGSWKRLLRMAAENAPQGQVLKQLWDRLDNPRDAQAALEHVISTESAGEDWRRAIIDTPEVYDYCNQRMIRFAWNGGIYPLRKTQMNGWHAELYTYCLDAELKTSHELRTLTPGQYHETTTWDDEPQMSLVANIGDVELTFWVASCRQNDLFEIRLYDLLSAGKALSAILVAEGFVQEGDDWTRSVQRSELKLAILCIYPSLSGFIGKLPK